jgi:hypothetical protein
MDDSTARCATSAVVTSDWLVRTTGWPESNDKRIGQERNSNYLFSKGQAMKRFFKFVKRQEVALAIALLWMVGWSGYAMTEAFHHLA